MLKDAAWQMSIAATSDISSPDETITQLNFMQYLCYAIFMFEIPNVAI